MEGHITERENNCRSFCPSCVLLLQNSYTRLTTSGISTILETSPTSSVGTAVLPSRHISVSSQRNSSVDISYKMLAKCSKAGLNKQTKTCHVLSSDTETCDFFSLHTHPLPFYTYWQHLAPDICWHALAEINQYHVSAAIIVTLCVCIQENLPPAPFSPKFRLIWQYKELLCHLYVWKIQCLLSALLKQLWQWKCQHSTSLLTGDSEGLSL